MLPQHVTARCRAQQCHVPARILRAAGHALLAPSCLAQQAARRAAARSAFAGQLPRPLRQAEQESMASAASPQGSSVRTQARVRLTICHRVERDQVLVVALAARHVAKNAVWHPPAEPRPLRRAHSTPSTRCQRCLPVCVNLPFDNSPLPAAKEQVPCADALPSQTT